MWSHTGQTLPCQNEQSGRVNASSESHFNGGHTTSSYSFISKVTYKHFANSTHCIILFIQWTFRSTILLSGKALSVLAKHFSTWGEWRAHTSSVPVIFTVYEPCDCYLWAPNTHVTYLYINILKCTLEGFLNFLLIVASFIYCLSKAGHNKYISIDLLHHNIPHGTEYPHSIQDNPSPTYIMISPHGTQDIPHIHHNIPMVLNVHSTGCRAAQPKNIITWKHLKSDLCNLSQFQLNTFPPQKKIPKLEKSAPSAWKNPLKIKKTTRQYKFFTWRTLQNLYISDWSKTSWKPLNFPALILN